VHRAIVAGAAPRSAFSPFTRRAGPGRNSEGAGESLTTPIFDARLSVPAESRALARVVAIETVCADATSALKFVHARRIARQGLT
jgi:hypothetical protein